MDTGKTPQQQESGWPVEQAAPPVGQRLTAANAERSNGRYAVCRSRTAALFLGRVEAKAYSQGIRGS